MSTYLKAILEIDPDAEVIITVPSGETPAYSMINWVKPAEKIAEATLDAKMAEIAARDAHIFKRKNEYKPIDVQLDQLYHDMTAGKLDATGEWHKSIKAVKDKYPKGGE